VLGEAGQTEYRIRKRNSEVGERDRRGDREENTKPDFLIALTHKL
jgi:hypothetical protein